MCPIETRDEAWVDVTWGWFSCLVADRDIIHAEHLAGYKLYYVIQTISVVLLYTGSHPINFTVYQFNATSDILPRYGS